MSNQSLIQRAIHLINTIQQVRGQDDVLVWCECEDAKTELASMQSANDTNVVSKEDALPSIKDVRGIIPLDKSPETLNRSLRDRWLEHCNSDKNDLQVKLINAVAEHEGWEESAISLVDEAIMPVLASEITVIKDAQKSLDDYSSSPELAAKYDAVFNNDIKVNGLSIEEITKMHMLFKCMSGKDFSSWWEEAFNAGVKQATEIQDIIRESNSESVGLSGYESKSGGLGVDGTPPTCANNGETTPHDSTAAIALPPSTDPDGGDPEIVSQERARQIIESIWDEWYVEHHGVEATEKMAACLEKAKKEIIDALLWAYKFQPTKREFFLVKEGIDK